MGENDATTTCSHLLHHDCLKVLHDHVRPMIAGRLRSPAECPLCRVPLVGDVEEKVAILKTRSGLSSNSTLVDAAWSLGCLGQAVAQHAPVLKRHVTDSEAEVRFAALWALGQMGLQVAVENAEMIQTRLRDPDPGIRLEAQQILERSGKQMSSFVHRAVQ